MNEVLNFVNEKTKVLLIVRENQLEIEGKNICPLNQQEIASLVPCGKLKVNQIIRELVEEGYVEMVHAKGRYFITNKGYELLEKMSLDEKWEREDKMKSSTTLYICVKTKKHLPQGLSAGCVTNDG